MPPAKNGDYAFLLHIISSLKSTGKGACILPHGVLFRGDAEADIRQRPRPRGYIKGIIGLPANLFYGTGIPACIIVLDKENAHARKGIFMIDASKGFIKDGNKNRLRAQDIHRIVDTFTRQLEIAALLPAWCRSTEIADRRTTTTSTSRATSTAPSRRTCRTSTPICAAASPSATSMRLTRYWQVFPACAPRLFETADRPGYSRLKVAASRGQGRHLRPCRVHRLQPAATKLFAQWQERPTPAPQRHSARAATPRR